MPYSKATRNISPYFDDFDAQKNFMRVIFQPAKAVQARELTTLQTILSNQIESMGSHLFKDGTSILGAEVSVTKNAPFIVINTNELVAQSDDTTLFSGNLNADYVDGGLIGMFVKQATSNAIGKIVQVDDLSGTLRIHLDMHSGTFVVNATDSYRVSTYNMQEADAGLGQWQTKTTGSHVTTVGNALKAHVTPGVLYIAGVFVTVLEHETIFVNNTGTTGNYAIGFDMTEEDIDEADDVSLQDPASGTNSGAGGANRWKVSVQLAAYALGSEADNFYQVLRYEDNELVSKQSKTEYADIMTMLARRTNDESGSYTVEPFTADAIKFDGSNFKYRVSPGKAYVNGYEVTRIANTLLAASKPRNTREITESEETYVSQYGTWVIVNDATTDADGTIDFDKMPLVHLMTAASGTGTSLGTARVFYVESSGTPNNLVVYLGDNKALSNLLPTCVSLAADNAGSPSPATWYADINPWDASQRFLRNAPIVELPHAPVQAVTGASYQVTRVINKGVTASTGFSLPDSPLSGTDKFATANIIACINTATGVYQDVSTSGVFGVGVVTGENTNQLSISGSHGLATGTYDFIVQINRTTEGARSKTLTSQDYGSGGTFLSNASGEIVFDGNGDWPAHYDVCYIELIEEDPAGTPIDVTSDGLLDTGQKNYYYDYSKITGLKASTAYRVKIHHWVHGAASSGDYFAADSYDSGVDTIFDNLGGDDGDNANVDGAAYANIYPFTNEEKTRTFNLRNCLDFRRNIVEIEADDSLDIIEPNSSLTAQYTFYLPRWDKVWIDIAGNLGVTEGIAEELPNPPPDKGDTMTLFTAYLKPYQFGQGTATGKITLDEVEINMIDHRNYTMRDIGSLEHRISSLEYYTSDNQLSGEAYAEDTLDANGLLKSKNGIFIDKFVDHRNGQTANEEYRCAMDKTNGVLRCPFEMNHVDFEVDPGETNLNINVGENTYTLSYTTTPYLEQTLESGCININPFAVARWAGVIQLKPMSDNWIDTKYLPARQIHDPELEASIRALYARTDVGIPQWGTWTESVIGTERSTRRVNRRERVNIDGREVVAARPGTATVQTTTIQSDRIGTVLEQSGSDTITRDMGERVVDITSIPFMRSKVVAFKADGLKPETTMIPFFGEDNVSAHVQFVDDVDDYLDGGVGWSTVTKTDATGHIEGVFTIPEETYRTGTIIFSLADATSDPLAFAAAEFTSSGTLITKQKDILSVEVPTYTTREISEQRTREEQVVTSVRWFDPIAQTFLIEDEGGVFIDSVDIFFCSKDRYLPVTLQIVETEVGIPSQRIVPFGQVTMQASDIISTYYDGLDPDGGITGSTGDPVFRYADDHYYGLDHPTTPDAIRFQKDSWTGNTSGYTATNFKFSDPVYLKEGVEYAIVLLSNSNLYNVRVSTLGERDQVTNKAIDSQPFLGSLLKSQNASTWTPDQNKDLKFAIHRCVFETVASGSLFLRTKAEADYWNSAAVYQASAAPVVIFDDGTRHNQYLCIADTTAGQSPTTHPAKWQLLTDRDGQHDVTLFNIAYDEMILKDTSIVSEYAFTGESLARFQNKVDIGMTDSRQVVELYRDGSPNQPAPPNVLDLKFTLDSDNGFLSPVIAKNRASAILVNNLTNTALAADTNASLDAGEYISRNVVLAKKSSDIKVLLDVKNQDINADNTWDSVVVKYRTLADDRRYVVRDSVPTKALDVGLKDNICYVYWINNTLADPNTSHTKSNDALTGTSFTPRGTVVIDGFDQSTTPDRVYMSSISDPDDFDIDANVGTGTNSWTLVTTEPDIVDGEMYVWNSQVSDSYVSGDYVIEGHDLYVANATTTSQPSQNSGVGGDWTRIESVFTQNTVQIDSDNPWVLMERTSVVPPDFDITSQYYEHTFVPTITPAEEFDNFTIKVEMYADNPVQVPLVRRLRAIATE